MGRLRQVVFYVFALLYLGLCPFVLSSAFGVAWVPGSAGGLERLGLLSIATLPADAAVFVNGRRYKDRTPMLLRGLQPGTYPVQVTLKGYHSWTRPLTITAGEATVIERLLLLPQRGAFQARLSAAQADLLPLDSHEVLGLVLAGARLGEVRFYETRHARAQPLLAPNDPWAASVLRQARAMPEGRELFCTVATPEGVRYVWVDLARGETQTTDLTRLVLAAPDTVLWAPRQTETLWVLHGHTLDRIDRRQMTVSPAVAHSVRGVGLRGHVVHLIGAAGRIERLNEDGELLAPLPEKHQPQARWLARAERVELTALPEDVWLLRDDRGQVSLNRPQAEVLATGVRGVVAHPTESYAALWNAQQVGVVDTGSGPAAAATVRWVLTGRRQIERAFWSPEGDYLLIQESGALWLAQLWRTPHVTVDRLCEIAPGTQAVWPAGAGSVYYLDPATRHLWSLELIPERYFSLLRFPRASAR